MAMLPDEQYVLFSDTAEKKRVARGSHSKRSHCGKGGSVKFPSDYMSKKEREAMNSEVKSYNLNKPMSWTDFRNMPKDLQITYIKKLRNNYDVPDAILAESFGISQSYISQFLASLGLGSGLNAGAKRKGWRKSEKAKRFYAWWSQGEYDTAKVNDISTIKVSSNEITNVVSKDTDSIAVTDYTTEVKHFIDAVRAPSLIPNGGALTFDSTTIEEAAKVLSEILGESTKVSLRVDWAVLKEDLTDSRINHTKED